MFREPSEASEDKDHGRAFTLDVVSNLISGGRWLVLVLVLVFIFEESRIFGKSLLEKVEILESHFRRKSNFGKSLSEKVEFLESHFRRKSKFWKVTFGEPQKNK